jgi:hypothetical protein
LWDPPSTAGGSHHGGAHDIFFNHDKRLINIIQPHGFPFLQTQDNLLLLSLNGWTEQNTL